TYQRARKLLSDEVGLQPGPQLQELERQMLNQDPALRPARASMSTRSTRHRRRRFLVAGSALTAIAALALGLVLTNDDANPPRVVPNSLVRSIRVRTRASTASVFAVRRSPSPWPATPSGSGTTAIRPLPV